MGQQVREGNVNIEQELNETPTNLYAPHEWRHGTVVAGVPWKNPVGTASGTFNVDACGQFYDVAQLGSVTTKGVSPVEWLGNPGVRTAESPAGTVNAVGLQNPGVDHYLEYDLPKLKGLGATVVANVAGHCDDDYAQVVEKLTDSAADMLEINVSCPNVTHGGMSVGTDPVALGRLMDRLRPMTNKPMIVKLTPNVTDIAAIARAAAEGGADCLSMINTLVGMRIDIRTGEPIIANRTGGVSGPCVFPVGLACVWRVRVAGYSNHRHRRHRFGREGARIPVCGRERRRGRGSGALRPDRADSRGARTRGTARLAPRTDRKTREGRHVALSRAPGTPMIVRRQDV